MCCFWERSVICLFFFFLAPVVPGGNHDLLGSKLRFGGDALASDERERRALGNLKSNQCRILTSVWLGYTSIYRSSYSASISSHVSPWDHFPTKAYAARINAGIGVERKTDTSTC